MYQNSRENYVLNQHEVSFKSKSSSNSFIPLQYNGLKLFYIFKLFKWFHVNIYTWVSCHYFIVFIQVYPLPKFKSDPYLKFLKFEMSKHHYSYKNKIWPRFLLFSCKHVMKSFTLTPPTNFDMNYSLISCHYFICSIWICLLSKFKKWPTLEIFKLPNAVLLNIG